MQENILNISFYKFVELNSLPERRVALKERCMSFGLKGSILISPEGINGFLAGTQEAVHGFVAELKQQPEFFDINPKESWSSDQPFSRMLVKIKKEIISTGRPEIKPSEFTGKRLAPKEFKQWLDEKRDIIVVDTRNDYEIDCGTFENAMDFRIKTFRAFGEHLKAAAPKLSNKPVVMFCTGGIRCEKATALAMKEGITDVYQLEGGILKYFEEVGGAHYKGDCFVFDNRVTVDPKLKETGKGYESGRKRWTNQPK